MRYLHLHSKEDQEDNIGYTSKQLVDHAAEMGFEVLALTFHDQYYFPDEIIKYAKKKGILLIPGTEAKLEGKHVLIYNVKSDVLKKIKKIEDLSLVDEKGLVIAPHPFFYMPRCLGPKLVRNLKLFHAIEVNHFYSKFPSQTDI